MNELKVEHLAKSYPTDSSTRTVFRDLTLQFPLGEITVIVGRSGCGKSTLLRLIGGIETPDSGAITMPEDFRSTMMYPEPYLITWTSVENNIRLSAGVDMTPEQRERQAAELMKLVHLSDCAALTPQQLSTGMKQRLALAKALASRSQLLLMDEPFASLDFFTRAELQTELLRIQSRLPRTILFVTHQLDEAVLMAQHIVVLHTDGTASELSMDDLPQPRDADSPAFLARKKQVMAECMQ